MGDFTSEESDFFSSSDDGENDSSSSDDEIFLLHHQHKRSKNENYIEDTVTNYSAQQFLEHFRVSRQVAENLSLAFENSQYFHKQSSQHGKLDGWHHILIFLWYSGHEAAGFRDVSDQFHITISSLWRVIYRVTSFISNMSADVIRWPTEAEKITIQQSFQENNFPGVIGVIDGSHIRIDKPKNDPDSYYNRKKLFSIQMQLVCDHTMYIRDVFIGYPGSVHDSRVLRISPLYENLEEMCGNYYLLGDSGYPCLRHLLTPFQDRGQLRRPELMYNTLLARNRYVIEHCFGLLKQKFRQLYHIKIRNIPFVVHFIRACCVLHNLALNDEFPHEQREEHLDENNENVINDRDNRSEHEFRQHVVQNILHL